MQKIIDDTIEFSEYIIKLLKENITDDISFVDIKLAEYDKTINTNLCGGYHPDYLSQPIEFNDNFYISQYIFKSIFKEFDIDINFNSYEEYENYDEVMQMGHSYSYRVLSIQCTKDRVKELFKSKTLKKQ